VRPIVGKGGGVLRRRAGTVDRHGLRPIGDQGKHVAAQSAGIGAQHAEHGLRRNGRIGRRTTGEQRGLPGSDGQGCAAETAPRLPSSAGRTAEELSARRQPCGPWPQTAV
jgi:hypothetical protein